MNGFFLYSTLFTCINQVYYPHVQNAKTEAALMKARSKLEEMADLRRQKDDVEQKNEE